MIDVPITPHPLTAEAMPEQGQTIGYTGRAFYGDEFSEHGYITGPLVVTEHTGPDAGPPVGFYARLLSFTGEDEGYEVYVLLGDEGRQVLHGYRIAEAA